MRAHRTSWASLVFGLIFAGAGVLLLTNGVSLITRLDWIGPIFLILVALSLLASAVGDRPRPVQAPPAAVPPAPWGGVPERPGGGSSGGEAEAPGGEPSA
jgi:threonine/homoserine/homoserine lactone efflux protein